MSSPRENALQRRGSLNRLGSIVGINDGSAIGKIKTKIRYLEANKDKLNDLNDLIDEAIVENEQILIDRKITRVRRVYSVQTPYKVGWIVDSDVSNCMICGTEFWFGVRRHHCRACGMLLCSSCSPFRVNIPALKPPEPGGSRVCTDCYGLKSNMTPIYILNNSQQTPEKTNTSASTTPTNYSGKRVSRRRSSLLTPESESILSQLDIFEAQQKPKYRESYRAMRKLIPPDITKTTYYSMIQDQLPESVANRIWEVKGLWLICMHKEDIKKIHIADLRGKYDFHGLDLREMQAVWYALPIWDEAIDVAKAEWREGFKTKMDWMAYRHGKGTLPQHYLRNPAYEHCEDVSIYDPDYPIGTRYDRSASIVNPPIDSPEIKRRGSTCSNIGEDDPDIETPEGLANLTEMSQLIMSKSMIHQPKTVTDIQESDEADFARFYGHVHHRESFRKSSVESDKNAENDDDDEVYEDQLDLSRRLQSDIIAIPVMRHPSKPLNLKLNFDNDESKLDDENLHDQKNDLNHKNSLSPLSAMLQDLRRINREDSSISPITPLREFPAGRSDSKIIDDFSPITPTPLAAPSSDEIAELIKSGQAAKVRRLFRNGSTIPSREQGTSYLVECLDDVDQLSEPLGTFAVLIELCEADVNFIGEDGEIPLMKLVKSNQHHLGSFFISRGANTLHKNNHGDCPLLVGLDSGYDWVLNEFQLHQEESLLSSGKIELIKEYFSCLVLAGYASTLLSILDDYDFQFTADEATDLMVKCKERFKFMKDPTETFDILVRFGATLPE